MTASTVPGKQISCRRAKVPGPASSQMVAAAVFTRYPLAAPPGPVKLPSQPRTVTVPFGTYLEVNNLLGPLGHHVQIVGPRAGRQVLPPIVGRDDHDHCGLTGWDLVGTPDRAGQRSTGRDPDKESGL